MADLATVFDVEDHLQRPLVGAETAAAAAFLAQLSALVRLRHPSIDSRIEADPNLGVVVRGVVAEGVARVVRNPDGKVQESIDDYTYRRSDAVADGVLYLTDVEWAELEPAPVGTPTAYTVSLWG